MPMDWDKLRVFHAVAEAGSFTHAGDSLNLSQSAISRQISGLESSLGVPLFHRHARGLILTEQGDLLHRSVREIFAKLAMTEARIGEIKGRPQGPLRVSTTVAFGSLWLTERIKEFIELYPEISLSLVLTDGELDLAMRQADIGIRMMQPSQPDLIQRRLMTLRYHVFAASVYLEQHGTPTRPQDLDDHNLIVYGEDAEAPVTNVNWLLTVGMPPRKRRRATLRVNSIYGIYRAVQSGLGVGALPHYMTISASNLVEILPELRGPTFDSYFTYPQELRNSKKVIVFRDFLLRKIAEAGL
jgi:DNA-binding transcriptional LysR family regulator